MKLYEQSPAAQPRGSREHNPRRVLFTHENKGKKYPYSSERQNTREKRLNEKFLARYGWRRGDYRPEVLKAIALVDWSSEAAE